MKKGTQIYSIFGEIEAIVATDMGFRRIPLWDVPPTVRFNQFGQQAVFAVVIPNEMLAEYERRVAMLRA